jgi:hypothetical protein
LGEDRELLEKGMLLILFSVYNFLAWSNLNYIPLFILVAFLNQW